MLQPVPCTGDGRVDKRPAQTPRCAPSSQKETRFSHLTPLDCISVKKNNPGVEEIEEQARLGFNYVFGIAALPASTHIASIRHHLHFGFSFVLGTWRAQQLPSGQLSTNWLVRGSLPVWGIGVVPVDVTGWQA
jgi:hypothetical protein